MGARIMSEQKPNGIVAGGRARVRKDYRLEVEAAVRVRYADELALARGLRRLLLRLRIRREIERRLDELAPGKALYLFRGLGAKRRHTL